MTVEEIAAELPEIPKAKIFAALTYYLANLEQIDADLQAEVDLYNELEAADKAGKCNPSRTGRSTNKNNSTNA